MTMTISKEFKFDSAHMLSNYVGKCANLHGHTYIGVITLTGDMDFDTDMLVDYNDIKQCIDKFDHAIIFSPKHIRSAAEEALFKWACEYNMRMIELNSKCTAENIAQWIADDIYSSYSNVKKVVVELHETLGSTAIAVAGQKE